jgi:hypothetical protein
MQRIGERRESRARRAEEEGAEALLRATSTKRTSEASTSPSGELWDEVGGSMRAMREQLHSNGTLVL